MAFNNVGPISTLAPKEVVHWTYSYNLGDKGAQFAAADVKTRGGRLTAFNQAKKIANGGVTYSVDIRNDGDGAVRHNLQGGGLAFGFNNQGNVKTLVPGGVVKRTFRFGNPLQEDLGDRGAQFIAADIENLDCEVVAVLQGKQFISDLGWRYSALYQNKGPATAAFNVQGGGFSPGFNNIGDFATIAPGETQLYHFYFGLGHGARALSMPAQTFIPRMQN